MTKRELNKKLKSKTLEIRNGLYLKDGVVQVLRAREKKFWHSKDCTEVDIRIYAKIESTLGCYETLDYYGPRAVRKFLRREDSKVKSTISSWVKLWGFTSNVKVNSIELVSRKWQLLNL
tara:strand:- start:1629 stop:1985 length:357 start_codon:yes stop_codon:yes gene_type:complete